MYPSKIWVRSRRSTLPDQCVQRPSAPVVAMIFKVKRSGATRHFKRGNLMTEVTTIDIKNISQTEKHLFTRFPPNIDHSRIWSYCNGYRI